MSNLPASIIDHFEDRENSEIKYGIQSLLRLKKAVIIVLDDDPTGAQYADVPVLTNWEQETIRAEIDNDIPLFYILTNSRSRPVEDAIRINLEAGRNIKEVLSNTNKSYIIISRSDSTLRGHFPAEVNAVTEGLGMTNFHIAIIPAFFEAGRYTINDVQYVLEGPNLVAVHQTPFAQDKVFGYKAENLKEWVSEKTAGLVSAQNVQSFNLEETTQDAVAMVKRLQDLPPDSVFIVNVVTRSNLQKFAFAYLQANVPVVFRTGPSFVAALGCLETKNIDPAEIISHSTHGGLIIIGSYVPKTTQQLHVLLEAGVLAIELDVEMILQDNSFSQLSTYLEKIEQSLRQQKDVVIYTSRKLIYSHDANESLQIGNGISSFLVQLIQGLSIQPRFLVAKGGITSHDIAVKGLSIRRALVIGQLLKGIPVWETGSECLFPKMPYIVFPGNVGDERTLLDLYEKLSSTKLITKQ